MSIDYEALNLKTGDVLEESNITYLDTFNTNVASAINSNSNKIGDLSSLTTTDKTSVVNAIKENTQNIAKHSNKNYAINGNFDNWQRGTSAVNPITSSFIADRFMIIDGITGTKPTTITHSKQIADSALLGSNNFYRINSDSIGILNSTDTYRIKQHIEYGVRKLCGLNKKVTISFYAKSSISNKKLGIYLAQTYGSGGAPSTSDIISGNFVTLSNVWKKYSITFSTLDTTNKTFGTNNDDFLAIMFTLAYGTSSAVNVGDVVGESFGVGNIDIAQIKVESGDMVTPFVPLLPSEELALCQRYYYDSVSRIHSGIAFATTAISANFRYPVPMRTTPTTTVYNTTANHVRRSDNGTDIAITTPSFSYNGTLGFAMIADSGASPFVVGIGYDYRITADAEIY